MVVGTVRIVCKCGTSNVIRAELLTEPAARPVPAAVQR